MAKKICVSLCALVIALFPSGRVVAQNFWERAPHHDLNCFSGEGRQIVRERGFSKRGETYSVDEFEPGTILFVEDMLFKKPFVLSKIDFAKSCVIVDDMKLKGLSEPAEIDESELLCKAIQLLQSQGAVERKDIYQLEELAFSGGSSYFEFDQRALRAALDCFLRN